MLPNYTPTDGTVVFPNFTELPSLLQASPSQQVTPDQVIHPSNSEVHSGVRSGSVLSNLPEPLLYRGHLALGNE
jgi:hypothetical protein